MPVSRSPIRLLLVALLTLTAAAAAHALDLLVDPRAAANIAGAEGLPGDGFGHALAVDGDTLLLTAPADAVGQRAAPGSGYVYVRSAGTWALQAKLPAPAGLATALGEVAALDGDRVALSEQARNRVQIYQRSGASWTLQPALDFTSSSLQTVTALAMDGDTLALSQASVESSPEQGRGLVLVFVRSGGNWVEQARLQLPATAFTNDFFGWSLAIAGDRLLVGAREDAQDGSSTGAAYLYERVGGSWTQVKRLVADDASAGAGFGSAVALDGDTVAVGAPGRSSTAGNLQGSGGVYVFVRGSGAWAQSARLEAAPNAAGLGLGSALQLKSGLLLAGALAQDLDVSGEQLGAAILFEGGGGSWSQRQRFDSPLTSFSQFARSVALHADASVLLGSPTDFTPGQAPGGAVRSWQRSGATWTAGQVLHSGQGTGYRYFGAALALSGNRAVVGAPGGIPSRTLLGGDYFTLTRANAQSPWQLESAFSEPGQFGDWGRAVALQGDTLLSAAPLYSQTAGNPVSGTVVVRVRQGGSWIEQARLTGDMNSTDRQFGRALAISGDTAAIGAFSAEPNKGLDAGAVYVFVRQGTAWTLQARLTPPRSQLGPEFGVALALDGDRLLVGAPSDRAPATSSFGAAFVYLRSGGSWALETTLLAQGAVEYPDFGRSVALLGDRALVAAPLGNGSGPGAGSGVVVAYARSGGVWAEQSRHSDATTTRYGTSVALAATRMLIGATAGNGGVVDVYTLIAGQWQLQRHLAGEQAGSGFGRAIAASDTDLLIGAPLHALATAFSNPDSGALYAESGDVVFRNGFE